MARILGRLRDTFQEQSPTRMLDRSPLVRPNSRRRLEYPPRLEFRVDAAWMYEVVAHARAS